MPSDLPDLIERRVEAAARQKLEQHVSGESLIPERPEDLPKGRELCQCPRCGRSHWKLGNPPPDLAVGFDKAADKAALAGAEGVVKELRKHFLPNTGLPMDILMEQAAATIRAQGRRIEELIEGLDLAAGHLEEMRKDAKWHPSGHCPVLDRVRSLLSKESGGG